MDHAEATATNAADRYLLGELSAAEADAFEEHYFDCAECADELRVGMRFMNGGRGLARESAAPAEAKVVRIDERRARRTAWLPAAVAAALVLAVGAPLLMRQQPASGPQFGVATDVTSLLAETRNAATEAPTVDGNGPILLWAKADDDLAYPRYEARLHRPDGSVLTLSLPRSSDLTPLTVHGLTAGAHELVTVGIDAADRATEIARHRFIVRR